MPASRLEPGYRRVMEDILKAMGRSDVAVEHVSVAGEGAIPAAFARGLRTRRIALPPDRLIDRAEFRAAIEGALADLTPRDAESPPAAAPDTRFQNA